MINDVLLPSSIRKTCNKNQITLFIYLFIYFWLRWVLIAVCRLSLVAASGVAVRGLLIAVASLVAEHRL